MSSILPENCSNIECDSDEDDYDNNNQKEDNYSDDLNTVNSKRQAVDKCSSVQSNPQVSQRQQKQQLINDLTSNNKMDKAPTNSRENKNQRNNFHHVNAAASSNADEICYSSPSATGSQPSAASSTSQLSPMSAFNEDRMRRKLQFFFMNPIEKWQARRKFPYKFVVQLIKIVLLTMQLCLFAHSRYIHVNYTWDNRVSFSHL